MLRLLDRLTKRGRFALLAAFPVSILSGLGLAYGIRLHLWPLAVAGLILTLIWIQLLVLHYRYVKRRQEEIEAISQLVSDTLRTRRKFHDSTAFGCMYWTGDRKGYNLNAICPECGPPKIGTVA